MGTQLCLICLHLLAYMLPILQNILILHILLLLLCVVQLLLWMLLGVVLPKMRGLLLLHTPLWLLLCRFVVHGHRVVYNKWQLQVYLCVRYHIFGRLRLHP